MAPGFADGVAAARDGDHWGAVRVAFQQVALGALPLLVAFILVRSVWGTPNEAIDFRRIYYVAGARVLHGGNPYLWTISQVRHAVDFVYPAFSALIFIPWSLLPRGSADALATLVCIASPLMAFWVIGVRDWRIYGITLVSSPFTVAWQTANETAVLVLLVALIWRCRQRPALAGCLVAVAISLKPLVWPLALWLLVTRRWRASAYATAVGLAINAVSWATLGGGSLQAYIHDSTVDIDIAWRAGYSVLAACGHLGLGRTTGEILLVAAALGVAACAAHAGLIRRDEGRAMTLTIALILAASPLIWDHYFLFLLIPLGLERPTLGWLWGLPLLMWVHPQAVGGVTAWQQAVVWLAAGTVLVALGRAPRGRLTAPALRPAWNRTPA